MDTAALIELSDLNYTEAMRELTRRAGGAVLDEDGLMFYAGAHPLPVLANGVMRTGAGPDAATVLARADRFFGARGRGYTAIVRAHADADLEAAATAAGYNNFGSTPAMVLRERLPDGAPPPGVEVVRVGTAEHVAAFAAVNGAAYATYGMPADVAPAALGRPDVMIAPHVAAFVALLEGQPAAAAMTIVTHGVAGIYWVGTVPEARGRGLAELVTRTATNAGFDLGGRIASLQASVMGEPVYRRMGYVEVTRYPQLVRFQPPPA
ncbi:MAG TPA: GNAT family N-acetyltransferase [Candidatus Binatia bacterium]|nr:GNAT family N-acetyltransferase [Candidatus Binatia bacterium]